MKKLAVCIPVYNRLEQLNDLLSSLHKSEGVSFQDFEICISDNASTDDIESIIIWYKNNTELCIKFQRNDNNLGAERNFQIALGMASADYVMIIGSDDMVSPESINSVIYQINKGMDIIFLNVKTFKTESPDIFTFKYSYGTDLVHFNKKDDILKFFGADINYISFMAIRRKYYDFSMVDQNTLKMLENKGFSYMYVFLSLLPQSMHGVYEGGAYIKNRDGKYDLWYSHFEYFFYGIAEVFSVLSRERTLTKKSARYAKGRCLMRYIAYPSPTIKDLFLGLKHYKDVPIYYTYVAYALIPSSIKKNKYFKFFARVIIDFALEKFKLTR